RDQAAGRPGADDQRRGGHLPGDDIRIHEDAGADDPAHHDHRGVERAEAARELRRLAQASAPARLTVAVTSLPRPRYSSALKLKCRASRMPRPCVSKARRGSMSRYRFHSKPLPSSRMWKWISSPVRWKCTSTFFSAFSLRYNRRRTSASQSWQFRGTLFSSYVM